MTKFDPLLNFTMLMEFMLLTHLFYLEMKNRIVLLDLEYVRLVLSR